MEEIKVSVQQRRKVSESNCAAAPWRTEYHFVWHCVSIETYQHGPAVPVPGFPFSPQTQTHTNKHTHTAVSASFYVSVSHTNTLLSVFSSY